MYLLDVTSILRSENKVLVSRLLLKFIKWETVRRETVLITLRFCAITFSQYDIL